MCSWIIAFLVQKTSSKLPLCAYEAGCVHQSHFPGLRSTSWLFSSSVKTMKHSTWRQMWKDMLLFVLFECNLHSASLKMVAGSRVFKATQGCHVSGPDTNQNDSADFPRSLNWTQAAKTSLLHSARTFSPPIHCLQCRECHCKKRERENGAGVATSSLPVCVSESCL